MVSKTRRYLSPVTNLYGAKEGAAFEAMQGCTVILNNWNKCLIGFFFLNHLRTVSIWSGQLEPSSFFAWTCFYGFMGRQIERLCLIFLESSLQGMVLKAAREDGHHWLTAGVYSCCLWFWRFAIHFYKGRCEQAATGQAEFPHLCFNNCLKYGSICTSRTLQVQLSMSWSLGVVWDWRISNKQLGLCSQDHIGNLICEFLSSKDQYLIQQDIHRNELYIEYILH